MGHRSTTQSKAFGSHAAVVADAPNRLHGADAVVSHGIHAVHAPVHHAVHAPVHHAVHAAPVLAHAVHAPVHHAVHAAPIVAHAAPAYHAPVVAHVAPAYHAPVKAGYVADDLAEVSPYSYTYAVADDYSGAAFQQAENNDGTGVVDGEYSVNLPDGRIQHVKYHANDYDGYVADVTYEGTPTYGAAPVAHAAPAYHAPVVAHAAPVVAHAVHAAPVVAHAAPVVAHAPLAVAHGVHAPVAHTPVSAAVAPVNYGANKPVNGYGHGQVSHQSVSKPLQGEHRATTQSKAFGSHAAVVADAPNRLHGAKGVVAHAVHAPVVAHAAAPVAVIG